MCMWVASARVCVAGVLSNGKARKRQDWWPEDGTELKWEDRGER